MLWIIGGIVLAVIISFVGIWLEWNEELISFLAALSVSMDWKKSRKGMDFIFIIYNWDCNYFCRSSNTFKWI